MRTKLYGPFVASLCPVTTRAVRLHSFPKVLTDAITSNTEAIAETTATISRRAVIALLRGTNERKIGCRTAHTIRKDSPCNTTPKIELGSRLRSDVTGGLRNRKVNTNTNQHANTTTNATDVRFTLIINIKANHFEPETNSDLINSSNCPGIDWSYPI